MHTQQPLILLCEPIAKTPINWLKDHAQIITAFGFDREDLIKHISTLQSNPNEPIQIEALIVRTYTRVDAKLLDALPQLKVVARAGVGLDNIDLDACKHRGIRVVHTPIANTQAVVEYVTSMMLQSLRSITPLNKPSQASHWHTLREQAITPRTCVGSRLGIIGYGKIGSSLAKVASALGMRVVFYDIEEKKLADRISAQPCALDELLTTSDVVSIHVDGRASNKHFIDHSKLAKLKPDAVLINSSRGFVVDQQAAIDFASSNPQSTLILDVHDPEPIPEDSRLFACPNIILTPHIAAGTASAKENMSWVVRDVIRVLNNQSPEFEAHPCSIRPS